MRAEIENALHEGESLSQFVEAAVLQAARRRKADRDFLARGRASLDNARKTGEFYPLRGVLDEMQARLDDRMKAHGRTQGAKAGKP